MFEFYVGFKVQHSPGHPPEILPFSMDLCLRVQGVSKLFIVISRKVGIVSMVNGVDLRVENLLVSFLFEFYAKHVLRVLSDIFVCFCYRLMIESSRNNRDVTFNHILVVLLALALVVFNQLLLSFRLARDPYLKLFEGLGY
jgi:hypothetical protein